jgi:hypothetical protein
MDAVAGDPARSLATGTGVTADAGVAVGPELAGGHPGAHGDQRGLAGRVGRAQQPPRCRGDAVPAVPQVFLQRDGGGPATEWASSGWEENSATA